MAYTRIYIHEGSLPILRPLAYVALVLILISTVLRFIFGEFGGMIIFWGLLGSVVAFIVGIVLLAYYSYAKKERIFRETVEFAVSSQDDPLLAAFKVFIAHYALVMNVTAENQVKDILKAMQASMPAEVYDKVSALSTSNRFAFYLGEKRDCITDALLCGDAFKPTILAAKILPLLESHHSFQMSSNEVPFMFANITDRLVATMIKVEYCKFRTEVNKAIPKIMNCTSFGEIAFQLSPPCFEALYYTFFSDLVLNKYGRSFLLKDGTECKKTKANSDLFLLMLEEYKETIGKDLFDRLISLVLQRSLSGGEQVSRVEYFVDAVLAMNSNATKLTSHDMVIDIAP